MSPRSGGRAIFSILRPVLAIRVRLTLWYVALLTLILVAFSGFLYLNLSHGLYGALDSKLEADAISVRDGIGPQKGQLRLGDEAVQLAPGGVVALVDRSGQTVLDGAPRWPLTAVAATGQRVASGEASFASVRLNNGDDWRVIVLPIQENGQTVALLEVGRSEGEVEAALESLQFLIVLAVPGTIILAAGGGLFLANRALTPIDKITRTAGRIGAQDLSQRLGLPQSRDEVGRLAATFDVMLERLDRAFQRQREFTADASHELRTPLAIIGSQIDVVLERPRRTQEYAAVLRAVRTEVERMSELVAQLLTLSRADVGREHLSREPVSLDDLAGEVVAQLTPVAAARDLRLEVDATAPVVVSGDQTRLIQLLMNLLDNALKYTPAGGKVTVTVRQTDQWVSLSVSDSGIGIAAEHLPQLFERFYRVDKARSRAEGGTGLGLAICDWIAQAHGGRIEVASTPGQGATFTVLLPRPSPSAR